MDNNRQNHIRMAKYCTRVDCHWLMRKGIVLPVCAAMCMLLMTVSLLLSACGPCPDAKQTNTLSDQDVERLFVQTYQQYLRMDAPCEIYFRKGVADDHVIETPAKTALSRSLFADFNISMEHIKDREIVSLENDGMLLQLRFRGNSYQDAIQSLLNDLDADFAKQANVTSVEIISVQLQFNNGQSMDEGIADAVIIDINAEMDSTGSFGLYINTERQVAQTT